MPTDEAEQDRLDMHHEIFLTLMDGALYKAPLGPNPQRILDVGTGTGIWAIDVADKYPSAEVIGTDLSPIQPRWVPPNCRFEVDDAEQAWTFAPGSFDFIHARNLAQGIGNWSMVMGEIYRCTRPGGYVELCEVGAETLSDDGSMAEDNAFKRAVDIVNKGAMEKLGRPPATEEGLVKRLKEAGFVDVVAKKYKHVYGPWPKDRKMKHVGAMTLLNMETGMFQPSRECAYCW
jgi:ubiquinone/menaquinone biosynthesis C-methylase UbiE